jgi:peptidoglycan/LPS O-acetylase OafA/YrhL
MGGVLQVTSVVPFFALMTVFVSLGYFICRKLTPYNSLVRQLPAKNGYSLELESMRGILALAVVVHHAVVWYLLMYAQTYEISGPNATFYSQLGTAPVCFFFFITGFLFWSKLLSNPKPPLRTFLVARFRRLLPAYLSAAALVLTLVALLTHFQLNDSVANVVRDAFRVVLGKAPELNGLKSAPWLWAVTWTLQLEFLFYLLVPFLGWFAQTLWKTLLFIGGCNVVYAASFAVDRYHPHLPGFSLLQALLRSLSFTFCIGFVAAHLVKIAAIREFARSVFAAPLAAAMILATMCWLPTRHGGFESLALAIPFVAIAGGCDFWGALRTRTLLFLGQISYSVYLIHCLVYGAILIPMSGALRSEMKSPLTYWTIMLLAGPVIIGMATLWNRTFELPFMTKKSAAPVREAVSLGAPQLALHRIFGIPVGRRS